MGLLVAFSAGMGEGGSHLLSTAIGGNDTHSAEERRLREQEVRQARLLQGVLNRREEILRYQLRVLEEERALQGEFAVDATWQELRSELVALLEDERKAEDRIRLALQSLWEAQNDALAWTARYEGYQEDLFLAWPVEPRLGLSAIFGDESYEARFGIPHTAVDIPVQQGSLVRAARSGFVHRIIDQGLGFNSVTLLHEGGVATLYGHVTEFLVEEGQHVRVGDPIARSGGRPGTPGAGLLSTGPHVHFEVILGGEHIDPLEVLSPVEEYFFGRF